MAALTTTSRIEESEALLSARLLTDERLLKSVSGKVVPVLSIHGDQRTPNTEDRTQQIARYVNALEAVNLALHKGKAHAIRAASAQDAATYEGGIASIEADRTDAHDAIVALRSELADAQRRRRNKIEYDALAKDIAKLPTRLDSQGNTQRLSQEITMLLQEQETYQETWAARKSAYEQIVSSLELLTNTIRDEKAEAERRRALDEDADAEAGEEPSRPTLDPNAPEFKPNAHQAIEYGMEGIERQAQASALPTDQTMREEKEEGEAD